MSEVVCPICGGPGAIQAHARIAPFISQLRGDPENFACDTQLCVCGECDLVFFSHRFDGETLNAIYSDYHNDRYLSIRRRWEPWYSRRVNDAMEPGSKAVAERIDFVSKIVESHVKIDSVRNIVDYGGDEGQFFPPGFAGPKYVIDVSGKEMMAGVKAASSLDQLPESPHLVTACGVLEHLNDPVATVKEIRAAIADDGVFYAEVPLDRPIVRKWHAGENYKRFLRGVAGSRASWITADFVSGVARSFGRAVPRLGAVKQSEHINYFSAQSLEHLLVRGGFRVLRTDADPNMTYGGIRLGRLGALAVPV